MVSRLGFAVLLFFAKIEYRMDQKLVNIIQKRIADGENGSKELSVLANQAFDAGDYEKYSVLTEPTTLPYYYLLLNKVSEAKKHFKIYVSAYAKLRASNFQPRPAIAMILPYLFLDDKKSAIEIIETLSHEENRELATRAAIIFSQIDSPKASHLIQERIHLLSTSGHNFAEIAELYYWLDDVPTALEHIDKAVSITDNIPTIVAFQSFLHAYAKKDKDSLDHAKKKLQSCVSFLVKHGYIRQTYDVINYINILCPSETASQGTYIQSLYHL